MEKKPFLESTTAKILYPLLVVCGIIVIFKGGFAFGHWLYVLFH